VRFEFVITDGETNLNATWFGRGTDYGAVDKAVYKAVTSGHKYFLMKLLNIGVGNEDSEHDEPQATTKSQAKVQPVRGEEYTDKKYTDGEGVTVKALPFFNEYEAVWRKTPASAEFLRQWIKDKKPLPLDFDTDQLITTAATNAGAFSTQ
jgi:hypothetical protein